jgi:hypothetical protein
MMLAGGFKEHDRVAMSLVVEEPRDAQVVEGVAQMHGRSSPFSVVRSGVSPVIRTAAIDTFRGYLEANNHFS